MRIAAIQMNTGDDVSANLRTAETLLGEAAADGVELAILPENFAAMRADESYRTTIAEHEGAGPIQDFLAAAAARYGLWLVGGTLPLVSDDPARPYAACLVFDAAGRRRGRYDKIHLFDVGIPGSDERYRESANTSPGHSTLCIDTPWGGLAIAVCYDLRFPEMCRYLADPQLSILALPAAFTYATGQAHWQSLLRARAIENLCYVVAAAQTGSHPGGRRTFGHSMIVGPWGEVLGSPLGAASEDVGVVVADLDLTELQAVRARFPALAHRRFQIDEPRAGPGKERTDNSE